MNHRKKEGGYEASTEVLLISLRSTHLSLPSCFAVPFPQGKRVREEGGCDLGTVRYEDLVKIYASVRLDGLTQCPARRAVFLDGVTQFPARRAAFPGLPAG